MHSILFPLRSRQLLTSAMLACLLVGMGILVAVLLEISSLAWSRLALLLQLGALVLALVLQRTSERHARGFLWYPVILAGAIYLWDASLPPPTLPDGFLRAIVPLLAIIGILAHMAHMVRRSLARPRGLPVVGGYVALEKIAIMFQHDSAAIRAALSEQPGSIYIAGDGCEYVSLAHFMVLIDQQQRQNCEQEGA